MLVHIDPTESFPKAQPSRLIEAAGLIPAFFFKAVSSSGEDAGAQEIYDKMVDEYGYGDWSATNWGTITPEGVYVSKYPEDKPLSPLLSCSSEMDGKGVTLRVYQHAILAVSDAKETIISRMD